MTRSFVPSSRALQYTGYNSLAVVNDIVDDDMYDPETNPGGIVNLGTTINPLMLDMVEEFTKGYNIDAKLAIQYNFSSGSPELRTTVADLLNRHFAPSQTIQPHNVVCTNGLSGLINSLTYSLLEENEAVLMPTPGYNMLVNVTTKRNGIHCVFADVEDIDQFSVSAVDEYLAAFAATMDEAQRQGTPVKAVLMCNPHNPLGKCYDRDVLSAVLEFCHRRQLHLIVDEIYGLSAPESNFCSALSLKGMPLDNLHVLYGVSKDWGFNGLRLGFMISYNEAVISTMKQAVGRFTRFSHLSEDFVVSLLSNKSFIDKVYIPTLRDRLSKARSRAVAFLSEERIPHTPSTAGFFLWVDLSNWTRHFPQEDDEETSDIQLARHLINHQVFLQPTKAFVTKRKGHFRFAYSRDATTFQEGANRLHNALTALEENSTHPIK